MSKSYDGLSAELREKIDNALTSAEAGKRVDVAHERQHYVAWLNAAGDVFVENRGRLAQPLEG